MKEIPLTKGQVAVVDDDDFEELSKYKWYATCRCHTWYAARSPSRKLGKRKPIYMHAHLLGVPNADHIDHNGLNNQRLNLREANASLQHANTRKRRTPTTSKFKGVCWASRVGKWLAQIRVEGQNHFIGHFESEAEAALAYDAEARWHFGEFAKTNFPPPMQESDDEET